jgi:hypothetical protein
VLARWVLYCQTGELQYVSKKGKQALSFANNVHARDLKSALSLVVCLLLEHSNVPEEKSSLVDLLMMDIKKSSKDKTIHANSIGKVNASFAKFVADFIAMSLLFDAFIYHNAQAAPAPWAGRHLSIKRQNLFQQNQILLVKFCLLRNEDQAWKLFGKKKFGTVGWTVSNLDSLWGSSVQYFCQFKAGVSSSCRDYQATYKGEKSKELMWIHHFVILQLFHLKFCMEKDICFEHENSGLFLRQFTFDETQEYMSLFHDSPRYEWLWLGKNY